MDSKKVIDGFEVVDVQMTAGDARTTYQALNQWRKAVQSKTGQTPQWSDQVMDALSATGIWDGIDEQRKLAEQTEL